MTTSTPRFDRTVSKYAKKWNTNAVHVFWQTTKSRSNPRQSVLKFRPMSDHDLRDPGIDRSQISPKVYGREAARVRYHEV